MSDHINLDGLIYSEDDDSIKRLVDVIKVGLGRSGDVPTKAAALADDIRRLGATYSATGQSWEIVPNLCSIVVSVAHRLPPDHPWQDTFVQAMQNLQQTDMDDEQESDEYDEQESDEYDGQESDGDDELLDEVGTLFSSLS